jgi:hypothetical protein
MELLVSTIYLGFPKIMCGYYIYVITEVSEVAVLGANKLMKIEKTHFIKLFSTYDNNKKLIEDKY